MPVKHGPGDVKPMQCANCIPHTVHGGCGDGVCDDHIGHTTYTLSIARRKLVEHRDQPAHQ